MISNDELRDTFAAYAAYGTFEKAALALGISRSAVVRRVEAYKKRGLNNALEGAPSADNSTGVQAQAPAPVAAPSKLDARIVSLQDENVQLKRELKQAIRASLDAETVRSEILGLTAIPANPPTWTTDLKDRDHSGPGIPMTIWSDWHWGEVVKRDEVGGVNEFNLAIAKKRARRLLQTTIKLAFNHQVQTGYPGIVVMLGGDMISGEIHQELADTNEMKTFPVVVDLYNTLVAMITEMARHFPNVFLPCVVGNHGRNTLKPRAKGRVHTSFEWLLYTMLERHFADNPKVKFFIPNDIDALIRVNNTRYLLTHGDALGVKGGDGIIGSLGPIMRGRIKTGDSYQHIGRDFDVLVQGHWHQYLPLPAVITNGCLKGYDEYARTMLRAPFQRPIQAMWYDHPKIGITKHEPIYLEDQLSTQGGTVISGNWVSHFEGSR